MNTQSSEVPSDGPSKLALVMVPTGALLLILGLLYRVPFSLTQSTPGELTRSEYAHINDWVDAATAPERAQVDECKAFVGDVKAQMARGSIQSSDLFTRFRKEYLQCNDSASDSKAQLQRKLSAIK